MLNYTLNGGRKAQNELCLTQHRWGVIFAIRLMRAFLRYFLLKQDFNIREEELSPTLGELFL